MERGKVSVVTRRRIRNVYGAEPSGNGNGHSNGNGNGHAVLDQVKTNDRILIENKKEEHTSSASPSPDGIMWGPIGKEVYERTYSRLKADGTHETWPETVRRVVDGNLALVDSKFHEHGEREKLYRHILKMDMIPAGRHLWATGVPGRQFLNNCHNAHWNRQDLTVHFTFLFDELMKGGGVGANYSNRYISMYPPVFSKVDLHVVCNPSHPNVGEFPGQLSAKFDHLSHDRHVVDDSREGWCAALREVLKAVWDGKDAPLVIDVSMLRERGAQLKSFGGVSSGPAPLVLMLANVVRTLNHKIGQKLSSLDMMLIDHEIARCVVSGNIRRSARLATKYWKDNDIFDFIFCKQVKKKGDEQNHWSSNISVEVDEDFFRALRRNDLHATRLLREVSAGMYANGEPGFWNSALSSVGEMEPVASPNPCGEINLSPFDVCNLGHINLERFANKDVEAREAFRLMTRFLIRATFGDVIHPFQREVIQRNRRIGVGFFGFHPWLAYQGVRFSESHHNKAIREKLKGFHEVIRAEARRYAFQLRIPEPIKTTCIAPTGSISNLPGTTSGCQPIFAKYFIRRMNFADNDRNLKNFSRFPIEDSQYTANTKVVSFYCKDPLIASCEDKKIDLSAVEEQGEISISDHLAVQAMLQNEFADNAISYTINFDPEKFKKKDIANALRVHLPHLKGTTLMPEGDSRPQMPFQRISEKEFLEAQKKGLAMVSDFEKPCAGGSCDFKPKNIMK